jgi:cobaltochelatase CobN
MLAFISAVETDLAAARASTALLPPDFPGISILSAHDLPSENATRNALAQVRIVTVRILGGRPYFEHGFTAITELARERGLTVLAIPGDAHADPQLDALSTTNLATLHTAFAYTFAGGARNFAQFFRYLADTQLGTSFGFSAAEETPEWGFHHPGASDRAACARLDRDTFISCYHSGGRGVVGILFYRADWAAENFAHIDALTHACQARNLDVLPVFVYSLRDCERVGDLPRVYAEAFMRQGKTCVDVVISLLSYAAADLSREERMTRNVGPALAANAALNVPLIQAVTTGQTYQEWQGNDAGLGPLDAATKIVMPEFDGKISGPLFSFRDPLTGLASPEHAQTFALANLAARYVRLRHVPNNEKHLAIVLTNFANRQGRVGGAVGLDTPASVIALLRALALDGYDVGSIPADGDALMAALLARGGYDTDTLTEEQLKVAEARYDATTYARRYDTFAPHIRKELENQWGPAPGNAYRIDNDIYVAGLRLGNVFVMIQPPRGFGENPLGVYHSNELVPTHHYLGAYHWLRDVFRADAIVQCGKHGTLEWLPGKGVGLSEDCYPTLAIGDIPFFYPFIMNDPGEGMQAKRRAHACIIDHLVPPMTRAETYDELAKLQRLLGEYAAAERIDPDKLTQIASAIWQSVLAANLHTDLGVQTLPEEECFSEFLQHIDGYLCELGDLQIRDGLHVLGSPPTGTHLIDLALALVRLDSPEAPGALHALCDDLNIVYEAIADPARGGEKYDEQRTVRELREELHAIARTCLTEALNDTSEISTVLVRHRLPSDGAFARTLHTLTQRILPNVRRASDELGNLLAGLRGQHVPAGPSGAPTRGMTNALPTGRNFYAIDIRAIPSRFAWTTGVRLGDALLRTALKRDGVYPRSIGISVWGTANMRTQGDDIAEILWLLGVRPLWHEENGRITGLEIILPAELQRPRIDVTVRISGFFRDSFPSVVALLDRAVALVADLDESEDNNYVRAATRADEHIRMAAGASQSEARRRSRFRVFGNKPGAYGTGVLERITAGTWNEERDIAQTYLAASGFAYGAHTYGEPAPAEFRARLGACTIAIQNQDNREHDIFDGDAYLQHHGGMIAAMRALGNTTASALFGDSSDPQTPQVRTLAEEARRVFRSRVVNPRWLAGMRRHGYKGALEMAATVDYLFGYDATAGVVEDWMYERVAQAYVFDEENRAFLQASNPWSAHDITERLLEAAQRDLWEKPAPETIERLHEELTAFESTLEEPF